MAEWQTSYKLEILGDHLNGKVTGEITRSFGLHKQDKQLANQMTQMMVYFVWQLKTLRIASSLLLYANKWITMNFQVLKLLSNKKADTYSKQK